MEAADVRQKTNDDLRLCYDDMANRPILPAYEQKLHGGAEIVPSVLVLSRDENALVEIW